MKRCNSYSSNFSRNRKGRWPLWALCIALLLGQHGLSASNRNVVLFVADDLGQDAGCYGNPVIKTPNLDALAEQGTRFTHAFCTTASCSASRSVILTGLHNHANGHYGHQHSFHKFSSYPNVPTLPVRLANVGYRTVRVGKYHVAPESTYKFDRHIPANARNPVEMAERSREIIEDESDQPFFLYFCTSDPHRGGGVVQSDPLKPDRFGNRPGGYPGVETVTFQPNNVVVPPFLPDTPECRAELAQYYQSVSRVDQGLGRLIEILKSAGQYENTLIIVISDHGIAFPGGKTTLYEPGMRSPCVVRCPDTNPNVVSPAMISWVDLVPTIMDFAGHKPPTASAPGEASTERGFALHGRSFLGVLGRTQVEGWNEVYASHTFHEITMYYPMRVVHERRFKLIWNLAHALPYPFATDLWASPTWQAQFRGGMDAMYGKRTVGQYIHRAPFELYDLENDPHETTNLAVDPTHASTLKRLQTKLKAFQRATKDPWISKWDYE